MDTETKPEAETVKKPPRKPRPSEIAAKKAKAAAKKKKSAPKRKQTAPKKKAVKRAKPKARKPAKRKTKRTNSRPLVRVERLDMRITKADKAWLAKAARKRKLTVTNLVLAVLAKAVKRSR